MQQRHDDARSAAPDRVAEGDRPAVDVQPLGIQAELAIDGEHLGGEGLVQLDEVDVLQGHARLLGELAHGRHRTDPHDRGVDALDTVTDHPGLRLDAELLRRRFGEHEQRGRPIGDARRVAGGDASGVVERRFQPRERVGGHVVSRVPVVGDGDRAPLTVGDLDRGDL